MAKLTEEELLFRKVEEKVKKAIFEYGLIVDCLLYTSDAADE